MIGMTKSTIPYWQRYCNRKAPPYKNGRLGRRFVYEMAQIIRGHNTMVLIRNLNNEQQDENN